MIYCVIMHMGDNMADNTLFEKHTEPLSDSLGMFYCGKRIKTKNHVYGPEIRSHYLIVFVNEGNAVLKSTGKDIPIRKDNILVMFPGERVYYRALSDWSIQWIGVDGRADKVFHKIGVTKKNPVFSPNNPKEISRILSEIYETQCEGSMFAKYKVQSLLYDFFAELVISDNTKRIFDPISRAIRTIEYNYNNKITVQGLAESLYLNEAYFSRLFKEKTGMSPKQYLLNVRLNRAKELLLATDYPISEISAATGFSDPLYFSKLFFKREGISPSNYRKGIW